MYRNKIETYMIATRMLIAFIFTITASICARTNNISKPVSHATHDDSRPDTSSYSVLTNGNIEFAKYIIGKSYHSLTNGGRTIYVDVVNSYTHSVAIDPSYHGLKSMAVDLSPASHSLMSIKASRIDFKDRHDLMKEGCSLRDDLGRRFGRPLSGFEFTAPHWPYWPSRKIGVWSGSLPKLFEVDESLWPTAKTIFATSNTRVGICTVQIKLSVVDYDEYAMSLSIDSESVSRKSENEFQSAFRSKHAGMTFDEWNADRQYRNSSAFKINEQRKPFTSRIDIAGWKLDEFVDTTQHKRKFPRAQIIGGWCAWEKLPEPFLGIYPRFEVALDESNRVSNIALQTDRLRDASKALKWFQETKEFLIRQGMDDCYEEVLCSAEEIELFINPPSRNDIGRKNLCKLNWVDKSKTLNFTIDLEVQMTEGVNVYFVVRRLKHGLEFTWQQCMEETRQRRSGQGLSTGRKAIMRHIERLKEKSNRRKVIPAKKK